jgi:hypothetical protein
MRFHVCLVKPAGYPHSAAFAELASLLALGLRDLGHHAEVGLNRLAPDARNIIVGCHLLDPSAIDHAPTSTIVVNTEQVYADSTAWNATILEWARRFETWDYSERNLGKLREIGAVSPRLLRIGFHPALARIGKPASQDIDVLFYGSMGERRRAVIDALRASGLDVTAVFGVYGPERDRLIARAKVVLNVHHYRSQIFEIVRVFYLMTNSKAVVCEVGEGTSMDPGYRDGIFPSPYEGLPEACIRLVGDDALRTETEGRALAAISKLPQAELLAPLLEP